MAENETNENEDVAEAGEEAVELEAAVEDVPAAEDDEADVSPAAGDEAPEVSSAEVEAVAEEVVAEDGTAAEDEEAGVSPPAGGDTPDVDAPDVAAAETAGAATGPEKRKKKRLPRHLRPARTRPQRQTSGERKPTVRLPKPEAERGRRQERQGVVVSDVMDKTIVVKVDTIKAHRKYGKVVRRSAKFHAHDEGNEAKVGDVVRIVETRPLSATKRWRLAEIVEAAK